MSEPPARCHAQGLVGASSAAAAALAICMLLRGCGFRGGVACVGGKAGTLFL